MVQTQSLTMLGYVGSPCADNRLASSFTVWHQIFFHPQIRNYAPNMIQKRKESASLVKRGYSASNVTIKTYKCPLPHHAT